MNDTEQQRIINDIGTIADRVRAIRAPGMDHDGGQIKALEAQSRSKWDELRAPAGPINIDLPAPSNRS